MSRPVWARGLKPLSFPLAVMSALVAPRVGAWIETLTARGELKTLLVAPRVGAWIETGAQQNLQKNNRRRAPCGRVD